MFIFVPHSHVVTYIMLWKTWILTPNSRYLIRLLSIIKIDGPQHKVSPVFRFNYSVLYHTFNKKKKTERNIRSTEAIKWEDKYWCRMADITVESQSDRSCMFWNVPKEHNGGPYIKWHLRHLQDYDIGLTNSREFQIKIWSHP